jgi:hypothetical protein
MGQEGWSISMAQLPQFEHAQPFNAFAQGRAMRQDEDYANSRNALAQMEVQNEPARMQQQNKLAGLQTEGAQMGIDAERAKQGYARLKQALDSGNPKAYVLQREPELAALLQKQGVDLASVDDETAARVIDGFAREYAGKAGMLPEQPAQMTPYEQAQIDLKRDQMNAPKTMSPYEQARIDIENKKLAQPAAPKEQFVPLTPQEIEAAGLPAGTSAQKSSASGKIDVLSKKDTTAALSQKDATVAKIKLNQLKVARQQLDNVRSKFLGAKDKATGQRAGGIKGTIHAGKGQGWIPSEPGQAFDKAVDTMRGSITAITRVPGVGSMSDWEGKIDQAKFPARGDYETITEDQIEALDQLLSTVESGYTELISGNAAAQDAMGGAQSSGQPVQVKSPQEAMALPPGTVFITPDGRRKVR